MPDLLTAKIDTSNLVKRTQVWSKAAGLSFRDALEVQAGLLVKDLVAGAAPRSLARAQKRAELDVKHVFNPGPTAAFASAKRGGKKGMTWLYASKEAVVGIKSTDLRQGDSAVSLLKLYRAAQKKPRGATYKKLSTRGKQRVMQLNRIVIGRAKFSRFVETIRARFGMQKASWAVGWVALKVKGVLPAWVWKHVATGEAKGVLVNGLANAEKPYLQIISRATGVERQSSLRAIRAAVKKRHGSMLADMRLYLNGTKKQAGFLKT
jgi:hypothetical protein